MRTIFWNKHKKCEELKNMRYCSYHKGKYCSTCAVWYEAIKYINCPCCKKKLRARFVKGFHDCGVEQ